MVCAVVKCKFDCAQLLKDRLEDARQIKVTPIVLGALGHVSKFGKILIQNIEATEFFYPFKGSFSIIYRVTNDLKEYNLKKGDYIYSDLSLEHLGDHIEVFYAERAVDQHGKSLARKAKTVLDLYGREVKLKKKPALGFVSRKDSLGNDLWRFKERKWRDIIDQIKQIVKK